MTSEELRRLAKRKVASAAGLDADAARLRSRAAELPSILDPLLAISSRVWTGPAAEDFERQVRNHSGDLGNEAGKLLAVAADLERQAAAERRAAAALRAQADAAVLPGVV